MQSLIDAVRGCCTQGNWYAALYVALTMPDICGKLEDPTATHSGPRYKRWFDKYLAPIYTPDFPEPGFQYLTADDCWALRCSLLHDGSDEISAQRARRVLTQFKFTTNKIHLNLVDDVLVLNVSRFCNEMVSGVEAWLRDMKGNSAAEVGIALMSKIETGNFSVGELVEFAAT
jgi:hypothetical protein